MIKNKKLNISQIVYCLILFLVWAVLELVLMTKIENGLSVQSAEIIKEILLKISIWFVPALIFHRLYNQFMYVKKDEIFSLKKCKWNEIIPVFCIFTIFHVMTSYVHKGDISINPVFSVLDVLIAFSVGFSEEMVFRGWLLNSTLNEKNKWLAVLLNSLLFLAIHFPAWIRQGIFLEYITSGAFVQIIGLSVIFGWSFMKSKSIIIPAMLHFYWDLLCFML